MIADPTIGPDQSGSLVGARSFALIASIVPSRRRSEWRREWLAELWHLEHGRGRLRSRPEGQMKRTSLAYGMVADSLWLRMDWVRDELRGSAAGCLATLAACSAVLLMIERLLAGSWSAALRNLDTSFLPTYAFVSIPALFAAMAIHPVRTRRCEGALGVWARLRSTLFLAAKVALVLCLAFLAATNLATPLRIASRDLADWAQLLSSMVMATVGLRWALLNQQQRCLRCQRMMGIPNRVGRSSWNFLEWSGSELACQDGHGLLYVPEMRGNWCWYDRWVEVAPELDAAFGL
jgi:hypothetical protein